MLARFPQVEYEVATNSSRRLKSLQTLNFMSLLAGPVPYSTFTTTPRPDQMARRLKLQSRSPYQDVRHSDSRIQSASSSRKRTEQAVKPTCCFRSHPGSGLGITGRPGGRQTNSELMTCCTLGSFDRDIMSRFGYNRPKLWPRLRTWSILTRHARS
jgi:hypothetical protein